MNYDENLKRIMDEGIKKYEEQRKRATTPEEKERIDSELAFAYQGLCWLLNCCSRCKYSDIEKPDYSIGYEGYSQCINEAFERDENGNMTPEMFEKMQEQMNNSETCPYYEV